jgi:hypothetical protein
MNQGSAINRSNNYRKLQEKERGEGANRTLQKTVMDMVPDQEY